MIVSNRSTWEVEQGGLEVQVQDQSSLEYCLKKNLSYIIPGDTQETISGFP